MSSVIMTIIKIISLAMINLITYPLVVVVTGGFFLLRKITLMDLMGKWGYVPLRNQAGEEYIWFHVSSAGEWNTGKIFARRLREKTGRPLLITYFNGDLTRVLENEKQGEFLSPRCQGIFLPVENTIAFLGIHKHYKIRAVIILETEIWPSLIMISHWLGKEVFLVNAVLFEREARHLLFFKPIFSRILKGFSHIACVSDKSRENFIRLGVAEKKISMRPNFKYDLLDRMKNFKVDKGIIKWEKNNKWMELEEFLLLQMELGRKIVVLASFHEKEILKAMPVMSSFLKDEGYCIIFAPREIGSSAMISLDNLLKKHMIGYVKRSELGEKKFTGGLPHNLVLDSFGELSSLYSLVDLVIMGGTFIPVGGHNFLEAIFFDKTVFLGRFVYHYEDFVDNFRDHVKKTELMELPNLIENFFINNDHSKKKHGYEKILQFSGSSQLTADWISERIAPLKSNPSGVSL